MISRPCRKFSLRFELSVIESHYYQSLMIAVPCGASCPAGPRGGGQRAHVDEARVADRAPDLTMCRHRHALQGGDQLRQAHWPEPIESKLRGTLRMMFIIGCGYVGRRVAAALHHRGESVTGIVRTADSAMAVVDL